MATSGNDEVVRLVLDVLGQQGVDALAASVGNTKTKLEDLRTAFDKGKINQEEFTKGAQKLTSQLQSQAGLLDKLKRAQDGAAKSTGNMGQSLLQLGRGIQDFQAAGLMGIMNNIEGLTVALGGTAGLAGVLTVAAVAFYTLEPYVKGLIAPFKELWTQVDLGKGQVAGLEERIKELDGKKVKLAVDVAELDRAKERLAEINAGLAAFDAWGKLHTDYDRKSGAAVTSVLAHAEGGATKARGQVNAEVLKGVEASHGPYQEARREVARLEAELTRIEADLQSDDVHVRGSAENWFHNRNTVKKALGKARETASAARGNAAREARQQTGDLFESATKGDQDAQARLASLLAKAGRHDLAGAIGVNSASAIEADEALDENVQGGVDRMRDARRKREQDDTRRKHEEARRAHNAAQAKASYDRMQRQLDQQDQEQEQEQERQQSVRRALARPQVERQLHEEDAFAARSGLNDQAALYQAMLANQGVKGNALYDRTHAAVSGQLRAAFGMSRGEADDRANRITSRATENNGDRHEAAYAKAIAANASVNEASIYANQQVLMALAEANQRFSGQAQQLRSQGRRAGAMRVQMRQNFDPGGAEGY